jgi:hypothetical protein
MFGLRVPVISVVIGEGGSGGALAIGCANKNLIMENSVYYVASPEACAAILWKSRSASNQVGLSFPAVQRGATHSLRQFQLMNRQQRHAIATQGSGRVLALEDGPFLVVPFQQEVTVLQQQPLHAGRVAQQEAGCSISWCGMVPRSHEQWLCASR